MSLLPTLPTASLLMTEANLTQLVNQASDFGKLAYDTAKYALSGTISQATPVFEAMTQNVGTGPSRTVGIQPG